MNPVRDDAVTTSGCPICGRHYVPVGRQRYCSPPCRTAAWRRRTSAPRVPTVPSRAEVVYQCPDCEALLLGTQRCEDCNTWARRLGPGGLCPHCAEPVTIFDLIAPEQFASPALPSRKAAPS